MKLIIAGSRHFTFPYGLISQLKTGFLLNGATEIVSGGAQGVDTIGEQYANNSVGMKLTRFPADWNKHGKAAGPIRNRQMAQYADILLLIWDGKSRGSANMKKEMQALGKPVYEVILRKV